MVRRIVIVVAFLAVPMGMLYPIWGDPVSAGEDDLVYYFPLRTMVAEQVRSGHLPLWNDHEAGGMPLLGDPQSGMFFPPNLAFAMLPPKLAYSLTVFLAFSVAGGGRMRTCGGSGCWGRRRPSGRRRSCSAASWSATACTCR